jgi:DNA helicase-2/ATP-dependent DNA helicase PcrA
MSPNLTDEQLLVINHPIGTHARVLAVAGSGKTTTLVYRIQYLIDKLQISPKKICILMFNTRAREDFKNKLEAVIQDGNKPAVHNFHSYSYAIINSAIMKGFIPPVSDYWVNDREERYKKEIKVAINNLENQGRIDVDSVDIDDVKECIGLWKNSMIPPENAGHKNNPAIPKVYAEFENLRISHNALTYDDFVPLAVGLLDGEKEFQRNEAQYQIIIVDEYQDVNYSQQKLIEILAGNQADVMLVGDDDQTIYEWRGARPEYLLDQYNTVFKTKSFTTYTLSNTFRFGPIISQSADNLISVNKKREDKQLISYHYLQNSDISILYNHADQKYDVNLALAQQIKPLIIDAGDPKKVIVLGRLYSQFIGFEIACLAEKIPYKVVGRGPFFSRREIKALIDYLNVGIHYKDYISSRSFTDLILSISNIPNRSLSKIFLQRAFNSAEMSHKTPTDVFEYLMDPMQSPFRNNQRERVDELNIVLERIYTISHSSPDYLVGNLLENIVQWTDYLSHFDNYYGIGEASEERKQSVINFILFAKNTGLSVRKFLEFIKSMDPTQGFPDEKLLTITTVYRVKGEEFDYVIIPDCQQGNMPCLTPQNDATYDLSGYVSEPDFSESLENERRLFYVAITRARKGVLIGTSNIHTPGSKKNLKNTASSQFIEEMALDDTKKLMKSFIDYVKGECKNSYELMDSITQYSGPKRTLNNMISKYGPQMEIVFSNEIMKKIKEKINLSENTIVNVDYSLNKPDKNSEWWEN